MISGSLSVILATLGHKRDSPNTILPSILIRGVHDLWIKPNSVLITSPNEDPGFCAVTSLMSEHFGPLVRHSGLGKLSALPCG
jgi:hypothetical protein